MYNFIVYKTSYINEELKFSTDPCPSVWSPALNFILLGEGGACDDGEKNSVITLATE